MSLRWLIVAALTAFAVTLALLISQRLSNDALALLFGIVLGCILSWPGYYFLFRLAHRSTSTSSPPTNLPALPAATPSDAKPRKFVFVQEEQNTKSGLFILK